MKYDKTYTVITGASSGIGMETAKAFASRGENLILIARRKNQLAMLKQEILQAYPALDIIIQTADLSLPENARSLYKNLRPYPLRVWINNAGLGDYHSVSEQDLAKLQQMLHLNVEALAILSTLFVKDYKDISDTQLINVSSCGGYTIVPNAVTYCATKYFVSAFTEGLAAELKAASLPMRAKVFAPAATQTAFGQIANDVSTYDYDQAFNTYHSAKQAAEFLLALYDSDQTVGFVDRETFAFHLSGPRFAYAGCSQHNQKNCPST